ncbi:aldo/keto reductase [Nonomuraea sp. CA-218870]|uniref:aldo/keto reductase n=1 Tax=Nonomuraea sp. CA-218870 TaxID=3239998 RepID=UPI003D8B451E
MGPLISNLGLGSLALSGAYGRVDPAEAERLLRRALDAGVNLLDTADFYATGEVERLIGRAIAGRSGDVVVATRGGVRMHGPEAVDFDSRPEHLEQACDASLKRLGTDHVGIYYLHGQDPRLPIEDSMACLARLVRLGKIRYIGLTNGTPEQLRRAHAVHPVTALAIEYSLWGTCVDGTLLATVRELGVSVVAARPLGRGFLTGRIHSHDQLEPGDWRRADPRFLPGRLRAHASPLRRLESVAARLDLGAGRLALAWLLSREEHIVPVPSTRDPLHLEMNLAASAVELPPEAGEMLAGLSPHDFPADTAGRSPAPLL